MADYGGPERRKDAQSLGYLQAKVDSVQNEVVEFKKDMVRHMEAEEHHLTRVYDKIEEMRVSSEEKLDRIEDRVIENEKQLDLYKHVWWAIKAIVLAICGALVTYFDTILKLLLGK